jgi:hypothetical protein
MPEPGALPSRPSNRLQGQGVPHVPATLREHPRAARCRSSTRAYNRPQQHPDTVGALTPYGTDYLLRVLGNDGARTTRPLTATAMCASSSGRRRYILLGPHFCCGCSSSRGGLGPTRLTHAGPGREWRRVVLGQLVSVSLELSEQRPAGDGEREVFPPARPRQEPDGPSTEDRTRPCRHDPRDRPQWSREQACALEPAEPPAKERQHRLVHGPPVLLRWVTVARAPVVVGMVVDRCATRVDRPCGGTCSRGHGHLRRSSS